MGFLSLHDDALLLILAHLHGKDALNVSLVSRRLTSLGSPRIASVIHCSTPTELRRLHSYMLSPLPGGTLRVRYLEKLYIFSSAFEEDSNPSDPDQFVDYYGSDFSQVHLIGDVLMQAENIREISLERFYPCLERDPRIGTALRTMPHLAHVMLATVGDGALTNALQGIRADALKRLTLSYHVYDDFPLPDEPKSITPLLDALSSFRNLQTVKLWNFTPTSTLSPGSNCPPLPCIQYLRLSQSSVPALQIVELCPNLSTLIFSVDREETEIVPSIGPRWRSLHRLMLADLAEALALEGRLSTVDNLQISESVCLTIPASFTQESSTTSLLRLLRLTSPISLFLSLRYVGNDHQAQQVFWREVPSTAPRLRCLELRLTHLLPTTGEFPPWLVRASTSLPILTADRSQDRSSRRPQHRPTALLAHPGPRDAPRQMGNS